MANAYMYQAAFLCEKCAQKVIEATPENDRPECICDYGHRAHFRAQCYHDCPCFTYEPDEATYDSGDFPKGPFPDGGGESDSPTHCDHCGVFLENPLTSDGVDYVRYYVEDGPPSMRDAALDNLWRTFYADQLTA